MAQELSKEEIEKNRSRAFWRTIPNSRVFEAMTAGRSLEEIMEEAKVSKVILTNIIQHPVFLKRFQSYLFDGAMSRAVIKIQLMNELWKNLRGKTHEPENRTLLNQFVRLLSEKDTKGIVSPEFLALIVGVKKETEQMSNQEKEDAAKKELKYEEIEFDEVSIIPNNGKQSSTNLTVDKSESSEDEQGSAD